MRTRRTTSLDTIQNVAVACSSSRYALEIWQGGDWAWYELLRESLRDAVDSGRIGQLTEAQTGFLSFVSTHLAPNFDHPITEKAMFMAPPTQNSVKSALSEAGPGFNIDNCPVFL